MRARWDAREIQADRPQDWMLSREEAARIRQGLASRARPLFAAAAIASGGCVCPPTKPTRPAAAAPLSAYPLCGG